MSKVSLVCERCGDTFDVWPCEVERDGYERKHCSMRCRVGKPKGDREQQRIAYRLDLIRVARKVGRPAGVSPSRNEYSGHGSYSFIQCHGLACGWKRLKNGARVPSGTWPKAMRYFGLVSPEERYRRPNPQEVIRDVMRVAAKTGRPDIMPPIRFYRAHGHYTPATVMRAVERTRWNDVAEYLGLEGRRKHASRVDWVKREAA